MNRRGGCMANLPYKPHKGERGAFPLRLAGCGTDLSHQLPGYGERCRARTLIPLVDCGTDLSCRSQHRVGEGATPRGLFPPPKRGVGRICPKNHLGAERGISHGTEWTVGQISRADRLGTERGRGRGSPIAIPEGCGTDFPHEPPRTPGGRRALLPTRTSVVQSIKETTHYMPPSVTARPSAIGSTVEVDLDVLTYELDRRCWHKQELAAEIGVTADTISAIFRTGRASRKVLARIPHALLRVPPAPAVDSLLKKGTAGSAHLPAVRERVQDESATRSR